MANLINQEIDVKLNAGELKQIVFESIKESVLTGLNKNKAQIENALDEYFKKETFTKKMSEFENALDWAIEAAFRAGIESALKEVDLPELVKQKILRILADKDFVNDLAEKKIRASLGIN